MTADCSGLQCARSARHGAHSANSRLSNIKKGQFRNAHPTPHAFRGPTRPSLAQRTVSTRVGRFLVAVDNLQVSFRHLLTDHGRCYASLRPGFRVWLSSFDNIHYHFSPCLDDCLRVQRPLTGRAVAQKLVFEISALDGCFTSKADIRLIWG